MVITFEFSIRTLGWGKISSVTLGFILGGAVSNLIDRVTRGAVVDFVRLHFQDKLSWPTFNLADVSITLGSVTLAVALFKWKFKKTLLVKPKVN